MTQTRLPLKSGTRPSPMSRSSCTAECTPTASSPANANLLVVMRTDGDVNRVVLVLNLGERNIAADGNAGMHLNAGGQDEVDVRIQLVLRQTIIRNAVAQHAAELGTLVIDYDLVTHQRQKIRRRQTARSAADDADALAGRRCGNPAAWCCPRGRTRNA